MDVGQWSVFGCNLWLQLVIAILSIPLFRFMRDGEILLFTTVSLRLKKDETPIVLYSPTTNSSVYYVKKTENADLKSGDADIVNN
ncbi:cobalamin biosynthesis protein CbiX [Streptococcus thermophilus]|nr:cobalamin biosynthesis protein CbiX [Streptococcus thermophilus]MCE2089820.1 cobalamin biosynthesis protein CbiX [Streptococcus thermophilus]